MYKMRSIYDATSSFNKQLGDQIHKNESATTTNQLDVQAERFCQLNLSNDESIELVLQLACTSPLLSYLTNLKSDLGNKLNIRVFKHCSLSSSHQNDELIKKWYSLMSSNSDLQSNYNLQIIIKPSDFTTPCLYKSDSNFRLNGEIKMLSLLNGLINSSMSIQVNDLPSLVHKLLLDEYLDYLQQCVNLKQIDQNKIQYYQNNLQINSKILHFADTLFKNQFRN